ncbi:MAG: AmmeMemoRadiSam system protein B [Acidobacteriota bacterium]|nr:AmmeMemoRadiSam system protein B [Acidobacteriota bacterium]
MRILFLALLVTSVSMAGASTRPPAVAGSFYTADPDELRRQVEEMLGEATALSPSRALVVPHAGYVYSGAVAGRAFATLETGSVRRVILLGPSHHEAFSGGALPARGTNSFASPLGGVELDMKAVETLRGSSDFRGPSSAHGPEHCLEVELPFLQVAVPEAKIVPILVGAGTDREMARRMAHAIAPLLDDSTVVVVSSDFTHHGERYRWTPFSEPDLGGQLVHLGDVTAGRLAAVDAAGFAHQVEVSGDTVCGAKPAMVLMEILSHAFAGEGDVVDVTTSGHRSGSWDLSVTYASVVFAGTWKAWSEPPEAPPLPVLSANQGATLVALARASLETFLRHDGSIAEWFAASGDTVTSSALAGAFVTLNHRGRKPGDPGRLRACMGVIEAEQPLEDAVIQASVWAAQDPRFPRLRTDELAGLEIEVSVLSPAHPVAGPSAIDVGVHGVILEKKGHRALFLPQVAVEQGWDRTTMLDQLARKASLPPDGWRQGAQFEVFTAQVFEEVEP